MANKTQKSPQDNNELYEKLRDELFDYRVDIKSYKRSMNILIAAVPVIITLLGFFGYNHIETLLDKVEMNANARLAKTDSILATVDMRFLDSLTEIVNARTESYEKAIAALEKGTRINTEIQKKLISSLPYNKREDARFDSYVQKDATNIFDIIYYNDSYDYGKTGECYVLMGDDYVKESGDCLLVEVFPKKSNVAVYYQMFEVQDNYNKLYFSFGKYEQISSYTLKVILLRKKGNGYVGYLARKSISAN